MSDYPESVFPFPARNSFICRRALFRKSEYTHSRTFSTEPRAAPPDHRSGGNGDRRRGKLVVSSSDPGARPGRVATARGRLKGSVTGAEHTVLDLELSALKA
jgi:hypothetical protein